MKLDDTMCLATLDKHISLTFKSLMETGSAAVAISSINTFQSSMQNKKKESHTQSKEDASI